MSWTHDTSTESAITRVEGAPHEPDRPGERGRWQRFKEFVCPWLKKGSVLGEEYARAKTAQETNKAAKVAEEAAEIAARRDVVRLQGVKEFGAIVDNIFADDGVPEDAKLLKLAKLVEANPDLLGQFDKVKELVDKLHLIKGVSIQPIEEQLQLPQRTSPDEEVDIW